MNIVAFLIMWLLCTVAFVISPDQPAPLGGERLMRAAASGALVAISIAFVTRMVQ